MDNTNYTTERRKCQHLTSEERHEIEVRRKDGWSIYRIAKHLGRPCEKGTDECHNRMLRRFIPKGKSISDYTADDICFFADCINGLPRKILNYHTSEGLFDSYLNRIYAA